MGHDQEALEEEVDSWSHDELKKEYMDLHAAYIEAEREIERRGRLLRDIETIAAEGSE